MSADNGPGGVAQLILYTKSDCELCHEAKIALSALSQELTFVVVEIDITTDPTLYDAFRTEIPVGFLDGRKVFKYRVDAALLRRQFARRWRRQLGQWLRSTRRTSSGELQGPAAESPVSHGVSQGHP
jgi:glutaredoxin